MEFLPKARWIRLAVFALSCLPASRCNMQLSESTQGNLAWTHMGGGNGAVFISKNTPRIRYSVLPVGNVGKARTPITSPNYTYMLVYMAMIVVRH